MAKNKEEIIKLRQRAVRQCEQYVKEVTRKHIPLKMLKVIDFERKNKIYQDSFGTETVVDTLYLEAVDLCSIDEDGSYKIKYMSSLPIKDHPLSQFVIGVNSILGNYVKDIESFYGYSNPEQLLGKRFFGIIDTAQDTHYFEGKRTVSAYDYIYRILPYVPYIKASKNDEYIEKVTEQEENIREALRIYRAYPKSKI